MRVLITGGAGFIGSHLAEKLLDENNDVTAIDNLSTGDFNNVKHLTDNKRFHFVRETILNRAVMDRLVSECDIIYHLAAAVGVELIVRDPVHTIETNVVGTDVVLQTAGRYRKKVLLTSTSEVYGKGVNDSFGENDDRLLGSTSRSRWSYACSKALDEFLALAYFKQMELPVIIVRLFNTIGPRQTGHYGMVVPRFIEQAAAGKPLTVYGDGLQTRCFCSVFDVVDAMILLCGYKDAEGNIFNIGNTEEISIAELAKKIIHITGSSSKIKFIPYEEAYEEGFEDMRRRRPCIEKIFRLFGWKPAYSLNTTLSSIIKYNNASLK
jgi:UDP-glucose 4-epimerase